MTKLEAVRKRREWSQTKLAYMAGMAQSDISAIENGWRKPYPAQAKRLATLLGLQPDELTQDTHDGAAA
jgi:ribosome-binding protein aMBF1 (putative translation factor)